MPDHTLILSDRRTVCLRVNEDGTLTVRAPRRMRKEEIDRFVSRRAKWIENTRKRLAEERKNAQSIEPLTEEEKRILKRRAQTVFAAKAAAFAPKIGVNFRRVSVRFQKTRWGSCSPDGNLSFNVLLLLAPEEVLDSVVVHELCHRKHPDHSRAFYTEINRVFPRYSEMHRWLKKHGPDLMARLRETDKKNEKKIEKRLKTS